MDPDGPCRVVSNRQTERVGQETKPFAPAGARNDVPPQPPEIIRRRCDQPQSEQQAVDWKHDRLSAILGPPPSARSLALTGLGRWLSVPWGYWIDRHRASRMKSQSSSGLGPRKNPIPDLPRRRMRRDSCRLPAKEEEEVDDQNYDD